jgi:hypothetical protein
MKCTLCNLLASAYDGTQRCTGGATWLAARKEASGHQFPPPPRCDEPYFTDQHVQYACTLAPEHDGPHEDNGYSWSRVQLALDRLTGIRKRFYGPGGDSQDIAWLLAEVERLLAERALPIGTYDAGWNDAVTTLAEQLVTYDANGTSTVGAWSHAAAVARRLLKDRPAAIEMHHMPHPGVTTCGASYANMSKTSSVKGVTCMACITALLHAPDRDNEAKWQGLFDAALDVVRAWRLQYPGSSTHTLNTVITQLAAELSQLDKPKVAP